MSNQNRSPITTPLTKEIILQTVYEEIRHNEEAIEESEEDKIVFRFNHLTKKGKVKLVKALNKDSSLLTVRKTNLMTMHTILEKTNPVIIHNWGQTFSWGQMPRYVEQKLSRIIYVLTLNNINTLKAKIHQTTSRILEAGYCRDSGSVVDTIRATILQKLGLRENNQNGYEYLNNTTTNNTEQSDLIDTRNRMRTPTECPECGSHSLVINQANTIDRCTNCQYTEINN